MPAHEIRSILKTYMDPHGPFWLEKKINDSALAIWGRKEKETTIARRTIERFLAAQQGEIGVSDDNLWVIYKFLVWEKRIDDPTQQFARSGDPFFAAWCEQCELAQSEIGNFGNQYGGMFSFYAWSEDFKDSLEPYIVRGAMRFFRDEKTGALSIEETQASDDGPEEWRGYFLETNLMCAIIAHRPELKIPKNYVLGPGRYGGKGSKQVTELTGRMLKVGDKGGLFASGIFMRRDSNARGKCDTLEVSRLSDEEKAYINRIGPRP